MSSRLSENFVGPPGDFGAASEQWQGGNHFATNAAATCDEISFYRVVASGTPGPTRLQLWDLQGPTLLRDLSSITDDGSVGWQRTTFDPVALSSNHTYSVVFHQPVGCHYAEQDTSSQPPAGSGFSWASPSRYYEQTSGFGFPSGSTSSQFPWLDARITLTGGENPNLGDVEAAVANQLADWEIATSDNTHQTDGLPWLTKATADATKTELDAVQTAIGAIQNVTDGNSSLVALPLKALLARYASDITTIEGYLPTIEGRTGPPGSGGGSGTVSDDILTALQPVIDSVQPPAPATWVSLGTTAFDTSLALAVEADLYQVTFTDLGSGRVNLSADGVDVAYRLAWWTEWDGAFAQERRFVDFPKANLYSAGKRMAGLLLHSPMGASGTVEAWTLS